MVTERRHKVSLFDVVDESVTAKVKTNAVSGINPWNGRAYSQRYYEILEKRKTLPVWHQKDEFLKVLKENQTLILVGETGSGKTTQVNNFFLLFMKGLFFGLVFMYIFSILRLMLMGVGWLQLTITKKSNALPH